MTATTGAAAAPTRGLASRIASVLPMPAGAGMARILVERNIMSFRHGWIALVTGFAEPVFYLFSLGIGLGGLVKVVTTDGGQSVPYAHFVAPGLLAASAMPGGCQGGQSRSMGTLIAVLARLNARLNPLEQPDRSP